MSNENETDPQLTGGSSKAKAMSMCIAELDNCSPDEQVAITRALLALYEPPDPFGEVGLVDATPLGSRLRGRRGRL